MTQTFSNLNTKHSTSHLCYFYKQKLCPFFVYFQFGKYVILFGRCLSSSCSAAGHPCSHSIKNVVECEKPLNYQFSTSTPSLSIGHVILQYGHCKDTNPLVLTTRRRLDGSASDILNFLFFDKYVYWSSHSNFTFVNTLITIMLYKDNLWINLWT